LRQLAAIAVLVVVAVTSVVLLADRGRAVPPDPVSAFPGPGAGFAAPETQISLRGLPADRLGEIEAFGSESGDHDGRLEPHSDGRGASFVPDEPFEPGERVTVRTGLTIRGAPDGAFEFAVARPARSPGPVIEPPRGNGDVQRFRSRPDLRPPAVTVTGRAPGGYVFLGPKRGRGQDGAMIVDGRGKLVWFQPMPSDRQVLDFRVQRYGGRPVLTWWEGGTNVGVGWGEGVILDGGYNEVLRVRAGNGYDADLHEFLLTERGTALMVVYPFVEHEDGAVIDGVVQEIDLRTGLVLFEWHSLDHIGLDEARWPRPEKPGMPFDYVHVNSVGEDSDGDLLISGRHSWAVYKVDRETGDVVWRLGGTKSDFEIDPAARFAFQHDARRRPDGALTLFDNSAGPPETRPASRAIALDLDEEARTAKLAGRFEYRGISDSQGNAQTLPNGHTFVGWGSQPYFTEYDASGRLLFSGRLAEGNDNYRAYRGQWSGRPATRPDAVAERRDGVAVVTASWNGATEVARWELLAGDDPDALRPAGSTAERGFETPLRVRDEASWLAARAIDARGAVLGTSEPVPAP
jgi:Arylsulfotransferase (ASST)